MCNLCMAPDNDNSGILLCAYSCCQCSGAILRVLRRLFFFLNFFPHTFCINHFHRSLKQKAFSCITRSFVCKTVNNVKIRWAFLTKSKSTGYYNTKRYSVQEEKILGRSPVAVQEFWRPPAEFFSAPPCSRKLVKSPICARSAAENFDFLGYIDQKQPRN